MITFILFLVATILVGYGAILLITAIRMRKDNGGPMVIGLFLAIVGIIFLIWGIHHYRKDTSHQKATAQSLYFEKKGDLVWLKQDSSL